MAVLAITVIDSELKMPLDISVDSKDYTNILNDYRVGKLELLAILMQDIDLSDEDEESIKVWRLKDGRLVMNGEVNEFIIGADFPGGRVSAHQDSGWKNKLDPLVPRTPRDFQETDI